MHDGYDCPPLHLRTHPSHQTSRKGQALEVERQPWHSTLEFHGDLARTKRAHLKGVDPFGAVEAERSAVEERITRFEDPAAQSFGVIARFRLWQSPEPLIATRFPKRLIHVKLLVR